MSYQGEKFFRIDLGVIHIAQPCDRHKESGVENDCDACKNTPERQLKVPHLTGFFVEVLNPDLLPWGKKKELYKPVAPLPEFPTPQDRQAQADATQARRDRIVGGLITTWNLKPADEEEGTDVLPLPKNDPTSLDKAPDIVSQVLGGLGRAQRRAEAGLPFGARNKLRSLFGGGHSYSTEPVPEIYMLYSLCKRTGWPPSELEAMPAWRVQQLVEMFLIEDEVT